MKTLAYPLMATSLSLAQCDAIMKPILDAALPALGINQHLSHTVVYGPRKYQGLGVQHLWTLQGILKLWIAIAHGGAYTITGCALRAVLALHTLELGLPGSMLQQDFENFHLLPQRVGSNTYGLSAQQAIFTSNRQHQRSNV
jgi:hypothetical protein